MKLAKSYSSLEEWICGETKDCHNSCCCKEEMKEAERWYKTWADSDSSEHHRRSARGEKSIRTVVSFAFLLASSRNFHFICVWQGGPSRQYGNSVSATAGHKDKDRIRRNGKKMGNLLPAMHPEELFVHQETNLTLWESLWMVMSIYIVKQTLPPFQN